MYSAEAKMWSMPLDKKMPRKEHGRIHSIERVEAKTSTKARDSILDNKSHGRGAFAKEASKRLTWWNDGGAEYRLG